MDIMKVRKYIGRILIAIAVLILLSLRKMVFPQVNAVDTLDYYFTAFVNCIRYTGLAAFLFVIGLKLSDC